MGGGLQLQYSNTLRYLNCWNWKIYLSSCAFICCCLCACSTECIHHIWYCSISFFFPSYSSYLRKAWNDTLSNNSYYIMACKWSSTAKVDGRYKLNLAISDSKCKKWALQNLHFLKSCNRILESLWNFGHFFKIYLFKFPHCENFLVFPQYHKLWFIKEFLCTFILFIFNLPKFTQNFCIE